MEESDKFVIESAENIDPLVSMEEDRSWDICICAQLTFTCIPPLMHSMGIFSILSLNAQKVPLSA